MRTALSSVLLAFSIAHAALAATPVRPTWTHTRPLTPGAAQLLTRAAQRSTIVRTQLEALEQTDVVVYVVDSMSREGAEVRASLEFVAFAGRTRYVVVKIDRWRLHPCDAIAWLGHELQHALEVAAAPEVTGQAEMVQLYNKIGWEHGSGRFETDAARAAGSRVRGELSGRSP